MKHRVLTGPFTFTSPNIYLAYDEIRTSSYCALSSGTIATGGILTVKPGELSSFIITSDNPEIDLQVRSVGDLIGFQSGQVRRSFNLADLEAPVPPDAFFRGTRQAACTDSQKQNTGIPPCIITEGLYQPFISPPPDMLRSWPYLSSCFPFSSNFILSRDLYRFPGICDPPIILTGTIDELAPATIAIAQQTPDSSPQRGDDPRLAPDSPEPAVAQAAAPGASVSLLNFIPLPTEGSMVFNMIAEQLGGSGGDTIGSAQSNRIPGKSTEFMYLN
jgi:hypothetical protein